MYICICSAVTERQVRDCVESGANSLEELALQLGIGAGCGRCRDCASNVLREMRAECECALATGD